MLVIISAASVVAGLSANIQNRECPSINPVPSRLDSIIAANQDIEKELRASPSQISWSLSCFIIVQGNFPLLWSAISEIKGRKVGYFSYTRRSPDTIEAVLFTDCVSAIVRDICTRIYGCRCIAVHRPSHWHEDCPRRRVRYYSGLIIPPCLTRRAVHPQSLPLAQGLWLIYMSLLKEDPSSGCTTARHCWDLQ